jgi:hypothetical protein
MRFLMAHYMPWYEADPAAKQWGWHWTMNRYRPERVTNGRPEAASHYRPLLGLYDSNDEDALECHVLLMKLAGIDGVIVDWYGTEAFLDYGIIHRNTRHLVRVIEKAGLKFAVCYEDQTVPKLIAAKRLGEAEAVAHGQRLLRWLEKEWFASPAYLTLEGRPVFLVFGPQYYKNEQWEQIFAGLRRRPQFFTQLDRRVPSAVGGFGWPIPNKGTENSFRELDAYYARAKTWSQQIPPAYPRFHDIYKEAGVHDSYGSIDDRAGKTYEETLERALKSRAAVTQLVTWNDWGEGTMIEPSVEFGYRDLEATQRLRRRHIEPRFRYAARDLRLPVQWFHLRQRYRDNPAVRAKLGAALHAGQLDKARTLLDTYEKEPAQEKRKP